MFFKMQLFCLLVVVSFSAVLSIRWKTCDSSKTAGVVKTVVVTGCETTDTCQLMKGKNTTFSVDFQINEESKSAKAVVHGIIEHIPVPFPLANPDACKSSGISCPMKAGQEYNYKTDIFVNPSYPAIRLLVKWQLIDEVGKDIFCIFVPVKITSSSPLKFKPRAAK